MVTHAHDDAFLDRLTKRRRALLAVLLVSSLATLGSGAMSLAVFTSSDSNTGAWSTGSITIDARPDNNPTIAFSSGTMYPGDTGQQTITVLNTGTGELRYDMSTALADPDGLLAAMTLDINGGACSGAAPVSTGTFGGASMTDVVLEAGGTDTYCFVWGLPLGAGDGLQETSGEATFTFAAEQTQNNP
jgi:hypothetical protein